MKFLLELLKLTLIILLPAITFIIGLILGYYLFYQLPLFNYAYIIIFALVVTIPSFLLVFTLVSHYHNKQCGNNRQNREEKGENKHRNI